MLITRDAPAMVEPAAAASLVRATVLARPDGPSAKAPYHGMMEDYSHPGVDRIWCSKEPQYIPYIFHISFAAGWL